MSQTDIQTWVDSIKDAIDDRDGLSPDDRVPALRELLDYIEATSLPDALAGDARRAAPESTPASTERAPRAFRMTPVVVAIGLPACPECDAGRGDPCRHPGGKTRMPHVSRDRVAEMNGIVPSRALCWLPARRRGGGTSLHPCRLRTGHDGECDPATGSVIQRRGA